MDTPSPLPPFEPGILLGIGCDLVEIERIHKSIERNGEHFLKKVFTENEIALCESSANKFQRYAARWAAKEAASKALGTGIGEHLALTDISVENDPRGEPVAVFSPAAQKTIDARGGTRILLSLSHTQTHALATAVLIK